MGNKWAINKKNPFFDYLIQSQATINTGNLLKIFIIDKIRIMLYNIFESGNI